MCCELMDRPGPWAFPKSRFFLNSLIISVISFFCVLVFAQERTYPSKPVKIIVPFAAAGPSDMIGRVVASLLQDSLGQPFLVDNRPGASGNVGALQVARAAPDGYTLLITGTSQFTTNPWLYKNPGYEFLKDFTAISQIAVAPSVFVVHPASGLKTMRDFITLARSKAGQLNVGNSGVGSPPHIASELLKFEAGIQFAQLPYTGASLAVQAVLGRTLDASSTALPPAQGLIESGRLIALAVTGSTRWAGLPNVPTMIESGFPDFVVESTFGLYGPAGMSADIVQRLSRETLLGLAKAEAKERLLSAGFEARAASPEQLRNLILTNAPKFKALVERAGIEMQ